MGRAIQTQLSQAPTGIAGHVIVDISAKPTDLRPVLTAALDIISQERRQLEEGQMLLPILGEFHNYSPNILFQPMMISGVLEQARRDVLVSLEMPYNEYGDGTHPAQEYNKISCEIDNAAHAHAILMDFLWQNDIATCFNDVSSLDGWEIKIKDREARVFDGYDYIDFEDAYVQAVLAQYCTEGEKYIDVEERLGGSRRNFFSAHQTLTQAIQLQKQEVIVIGGTGHVFGEYGYNGTLPYSESLCSTFLQVVEKLKIIPPYIVPIVPLTGKRKYDDVIFSEASNHKGGALFIKGLNYSRGLFPMSEENFLKKIWRNTGRDEGGGIEEPMSYHRYQEIANQCEELAL